MRMDRFSEDWTSVRFTSGRPAWLRRTCATSTASASSILPVEVAVWRHDAVGRFQAEEAAGRGEETAVEAAARRGDA